MKSIRQIAVISILLILTSCGSRNFYKQKYTDLKPFKHNIEKINEQDVSFDIEPNSDDLKKKDDKIYLPEFNFSSDSPIVAKISGEPDSLELTIIKGVNSGDVFILETPYDEYLMTGVSYDPITHTLKGQSVKLRRKNYPTDENYTELVCARIEIDESGNTIVHLKDVKETTRVLESGDVDLFYVDRELDFKQEFLIMDSRVKPKSFFLMALYFLTAFILFATIGLLFNFNFLLIAAVVYLFGITNLILGAKWNARNKRYEKKFGALRTEKYDRIGKLIWVLMWIFGAVLAFIPLLIALLTIRNDEKMDAEN